MTNALKLRYSPDLQHAPVEFPQEDSSLAEAAISVWEDIKRHKLERHIAELEVLGYTIVPPERVAPEGAGWRRRRRRPGPGHAEHISARATSP